MRPEAELGVGMDRVQEGKVLDRGLNRLAEVELREQNLGSLP